MHEVPNSQNPEELIDIIRKALAQYPDDQKPEVILVGQDESMLNRAAEMSFAAQGVKVRVVTPAEAKLIDMGIERGSDVVKISRTELQSSLFPVMKKTDFHNSSNDVNPNSRKYKKRHNWPKK